MTTAVLFPGQGSQRQGMGKELFGRYPAIEREAEEILGYSVRELCLEDSGGRLGDTEFTQPARYVVNALAWQAALDEGLTADVLLGHSVGEYTALLAAGAFSFGTGLRLVSRRARAMAGVPGGMSVVLGLAAARIAEVLRDAGLSGIDLANLNAANQTVIAGPSDQLAAATGPLSSAGAVAVRALNVSGPFHSRYMRAAARAFARDVYACSLSAPQVPVIANRTARPYPAGDIGRLLVEQIGHRVLWADSLAYVLRQDPDTAFAELGGTRQLGSTVRSARELAGKTS